jgi:hypothetical protein
MLLSALLFANSEQRHSIGHTFKQAANHVSRRDDHVPAICRQVNDILFDT